jgi:UDP-glucose 4-epimerase
MILLTGGCGFIGSHTVVELLNQGYEVIIVDNLSNSNMDVLNKIEKITGKTLKFYNIDIRKEEELDELFKCNNIDSVIHFAAFKAVGESVQDPLKYMDNNIIGMITLLKIMNKYNVKKLVFSSSCTVYGHPTKLPLTEDSSLNILSPYGRTKLIGEQILQDLYKSDQTWSFIILRYFNPVGAHESGILGEVPSGIPNNLFPYILEVIKGDRTHLNIYGYDYKTPDGTAIRDYIHVVDLALGHIKSLEHIKPGIQIYNLGTGKGYSVLNIVDTFNKVITKIKSESIKFDNKNISNIKINLVTYKLTERREGDSEMVYADSSLAKNELGWIPVRNLEKMVIDSLNYILMNSI